MNWLVKGNVCPGLFYGISAQDGFLIRLRTPGGIINGNQGKAIATLIQEWGSDTILITNRANLQIRSVQNAPTLEVLQTLQKLGLAAANPNIDHLRNVMISPTAGIDSQELIDPRPLVQIIDNYIQNHPTIFNLNPKFSIGIDSGGAVGIGTRSAISWEHRYNEIQLSAVAIDSQIYFRLALGGDKYLEDTNYLITPENCLGVVDTLVKVYLDYVEQNYSPTGKKPRLKHLLKDWGMTKYLQQVNGHLKYSLQLAPESTTLPPTQPYYHLGIHPQKQGELSYIGVNLQLGKLTVRQLLGLIKISESFGSGQLRLTPWQTVIIPDVPQKKVSNLLPQLEVLGLSVGKMEGAIVACAGKPNCGSGATQTQLHGRLLGDYLNNKFTFNAPLNIHLTACPKSCAQPSPAEITLLGTVIEKQEETIEGYYLYFGDGNSSLKYQISNHPVPFPEVMLMLAEILTIYQQNPQISFGEFTHRYLTTSPLKNGCQEGSNHA